jgi:hypothetical protein
MDRRRYLELEDAQKKEEQMKKAIIGFLGLMVLAVAAAPTAFGWERGTHAFIAELVRRGGGPSTVEAMYASTLPDAFNYLFSEPGSLYREFLYDQTHFHFLQVWKAAKNGDSKNAARGFVSHNNEWGADRTAHVRSLTLEPNEGYVVTKAKMLNELLKSQSPEYAALVESVPDMAIEICHDIVEAAGDLILKHFDSSVGRRLVDLARLPHPDGVNLMVKAYADDLADFSRTTAAPLDKKKAERFIKDVEAEFRSGVIAYGYLLQGDDAGLKANIIEMYKSMAAAFLTSYGIIPPDDAVLAALISGALDGALYLCQSDYMTEVLATADMVKSEIRHRLN